MEKVDAAPALRLGLAPALALGWALTTNDVVPFLSAIFAANLLLSPTQPPLGMLARVFVAVAVAALGVTWIGRSFADTSLALWLALLALTVACFARLIVAPRDLVALISLVVTALVIVMMPISVDLAAALPWLMGKAYLQACAVVLLAHALLPGRPGGSGAPASGAASANLASSAVATRPALQAFGKAAAMLSALGVALHLEDASAVLVAITVTNVLRNPEPAVGLGFGQMLIVANLWAALLALPIIIAASIQLPSAALLAATLAGALWLAAGVGKTGKVGVRASMGLPAYLTLLGVLLPNAGEDAGEMLIYRLLTLALSVAYAIAVLAVLWPRSVAPLHKSHLTNSDLQNG